MTVPTEISYTGPYYPNGVTVAFPFLFKAFSKDDLALGWVGSDGVFEAISPALYTVALAAGESAGGTVTTLTPLAADPAGRPLYVLLDPDFEQNIKFEDEGAFNQSILNPGLDQAALRSIWLKGQVERSLRVPFGETGPTLGSSASRAGKFLGGSLVDGALVFVEGTDANSLLKEDLATPAEGKGTDLSITRTGATVTDVLGKLPSSPFRDYQATGDGVADDTVAFAAALAVDDRVQVDSPIRLRKTQAVGYEQSINGYGRYGEIYVDGDHALTNDILFNFNTNDTGEAALFQTRNLPASRLRDIRLNFEAARDAGEKIEAVTFGSGLIVDNVQVNMAVGGFRQAKSGTSYSDKITFRQVHFRDFAVQGADDWCINLPYFGDGLTLEAIEFSSVRDGPAERMSNGVYAKWRMGSRLDCLINGFHWMDRCNSFRFHGYHGERGVFRGTDSFGAIENSIFFRRVSDATYLDFDKPAIELTTNNDLSYSGVYHISNILAAYWPSFKNGYPVNGYDLSIDLARARTTIKDFYRWHGSDVSDVGEATALGVRAELNGAAFASFNNYSHIASQDCVIENEALVMRISRAATSTGPGLGAGGLSAKASWSRATGTFVARAVVLIDPVRRIGYIGSTPRSYNMTNGGNAMRLQLEKRNHAMMHEIYLGPSDGNYDEIARIPVCNGRQLYYAGSDIGGYIFSARAAGAPDGVNSDLLGGIVIEPGENGSGPYGRARIRTTSDLLSAPSFGTFATGDVIWNKYGEIQYDGANWVRLSGRAYVNDDMGDAGLNISSASWNGGHIAAVTALTADRNLTLPPPVRGSSPFFVTRPATGAFNLNIIYGAMTVALAAGETAIVSVKADGSGYNVVKI